MEKLVETQELCANFYTFEGVVRALNGVSVVVNHGETYGLVGESGCGKSVTVRSMMRIVQEPGQIDGGKILLFFSKDGRTKGMDLLTRSEAYMRSVRGNDMSMIFQEASTSLNPVLSIGDQVGESFYLHRLEEMLKSARAEVERELEGRLFFLTRGWKGFQRAMFGREIHRLKLRDEMVADIDAELLKLGMKTDPASEGWRETLNNRRDRIRTRDPLVEVAKRFPFLRRYYRRVERVVRRAVIEVLTQLGVPNPANVVDRYPHELSGGMQQRIVIAIALSCHPALLIADEPTSNLDVTIQAQIVDLIRRLKKTRISSVLFITHDLGLVAEICDRVTVMYAGDVVETASVRELFRSPLHPYTQGLLHSVPGLEQEGELPTIPGTVPNLVHPPSGCRFHPRCPHAMDICAEEKPEAREHSPNHWVACHLHDPSFPAAPHDSLSHSSPEAIA